MNEELYEFLLSLPQDLCLEVMTQALEIMQAHNSQSVTAAVCRALNAKEGMADSGNPKFWPPGTDETGPTLQ